MRRMRLSQLTGNEILGKRIYDDGGRTLLAEGVKLTEILIKRLNSLGISSVYIEDEISKDVWIDDYIIEETRQKSKQAIKDTVDKYMNHGNLGVSSICASADAIIDEIMSQREVMVNIADIRSKDENLYSHSVNVCALSVIAGTHMGFRMSRLKELAVGSLMHDIGKVELLKQAKENQGKAVSIQSIDISGHPRAGYNILNKQFEISAVSKIIVLMHHENCDGTGYPLGLKKNEIHEAARLVSICNTFDNLVSGLSAEKAMYAYEAIEYIVGMGTTLFDGELVKRFIENIAIYPSGGGIILNTGERGIVLKQNRNNPTRPLIRLIFDKSKNVLATPIEVDLTKEMTAFIVGVCEI
jgi:HD-GYP domain-containing protein (c-di-GMP phosphodiesterase class II)